MTHYIRTHWQGKQSLAWSIWVNLVALRTLLFLGQRALKPEEGLDYAHQVWPVLALVFVLHGLVFAWQVVGTWRATEQYVINYGSQSTVWGVQVILLLLFWLTLSHAWEGWQMTQPIPSDEMSLAELQQQRINLSVVTFDSASLTLSISGPISPGITKRIRAVLNTAPEARRVLLESNGGDIYEGRGLAKLFKERELSTHVDTFCASACTSAYIGGSPRTLGPEGKLGFHQYRVNADYPIVATSTADEQARDQELFYQAGVDVTFVEKMFDSAAATMWWPDVDELMNSGVVDAIH